MVMSAHNVVGGGFIVLPENKGRASRQVFVMVTSNKTIIWKGSIGHIGFGASSKIHQVFLS